MGLRRIGRRIGRAFRRVGRAFRGITRIGKNIISRITKPLSKILAPLSGMLNNVLGMIPGGQFLSGLLQQFGGNPLALLAGGFLGPVGALLGGAGGASGLLNMLGPMSQISSFANPQGRSNMLNLVAFNHARFL